MEVIVPVIPTVNEANRATSSVINNNKKQKTALPSEKAVDSRITSTMSKIIGGNLPATVTTEGVVSNGMSVEETVEISVVTDTQTINETNQNKSMSELVDENAVTIGEKQNKGLVAQNAVHDGTQSILSAAAGTNLPTTSVVTENEISNAMSVGEPYKMETVQTINEANQTTNSLISEKDVMSVGERGKEVSINAMHGWTHSSPNILLSSTVHVPKISLADIDVGVEIGRGAFGVVYKGKWVGTTVAVKEMAIKRMKIAKPFINQELSLRSKVRHPNIVMLMAYATENNRLYLVSEFIDGNILDNVLFDGGSEVMTLSIKMSVSKNISQAVAYLHSQKPPIIHRDIKPENILVADNFKVVKLCDMGLSKLKTMNTIMTTIAGGSLQPGTPAYQAPEVLLYRHSSNTMTDVWSLSCTLVEIFCEMPIWNIPEDTDTDHVQYITEKMKIKAKPDGLDLLESLVGIEILNMLDRGLFYRAEERPQALEIIDYFV